MSPYIFVLFLKQFLNLHLELIISGEIMMNEVKFIGAASIVMSLLVIAIIVIFLFRTHLNLVTRDSLG